MKRKKILGSIFEWLGKLVITHPKAIFVFFILVTIGMFLFAIRVRVNPDLLLLLPENDPEVAEYENLNKFIGTERSFIIGIYTEGKIEKGKKFAREIVAKLNSMEGLVSYIHNNNSPELMKTYGMYFLSKSDLHSLKKDLDNFNSSIQGLSKSIALSSFVKIFSSIDNFQTYIDKLTINPEDIKDNSYIISKNGNMILIYACMTHKANDMAFVNMVIPRLRKAIDILNKKYNLPYRFAGRYEQIYEANQQGNIDLMMTLILSLICVVFLFYIFYRNVLLSIGILCSLGISVIWTLGFVRLSYGYLNLISISIVVILIGLGMDYGIHLTNKFMKLRYRRKTVDESIYAAISQTGISIFGGVLITVFAFLSLSFLNFPALSQIGLISAVGAIFSFTSMIGFFPSILLIFKKYIDKQSPEAPITKKIYKWYDVFLNKHYKRIIDISIIVTLIFTYFTVKLLTSYDYNLSSLFNPHRDSSILARDIAKEFQIKSLAQVVVLADSINEIERITGELKTFEYAGKINSIFDILPSSVDDEKISLVNDVCKRLKGISNNVLLRMVIKKYGLESMVLKPLLPQDRPSLMEEIYKIYNKGLPYSMKREYIVKSGNSIRYSINLSPNVDIYENNNLKSFLEALRKYDLHFIGYPILQYKLMKLIQDNMIIAFLLVLTVVFVMVWLVVARTWAALLSLSMLLLSINIMFGAMYLLGLRINLVTFVVSPLIIGIGINSFVRILDRYLEKEGNKIGILITEMSKTLTLSSLTTITAFAALVFTQTRLLADLGLSMIIGIASCYFVAEILLLAILKRKGK